MRKVVILIMVMTMSVAMFAQKGQKIGHINSNELLTAMPERAAVEKELEAKANDLKIQLDAMRKEYETKVADFQSKQDNMTALIKQTKIKEITDLEKRIAEFQQNAEADLQKSNQELLQPIIDKAKKAIDDVAKENNYTYILDSTGGIVLYSTPGDDILPLVKKKLGME
jgi:outer membrane protein